MPDRQLALTLGVRVGTVRSACVVRGISACVAPCGATTASPSIDWAEVADRGGVPDARIAERLGVHADLVGAARRRKGIPAVAEDPKRAIDWDQEPLGVEHDEAFWRDASS